MLNYPRILKKRIYQSPFYLAWNEHGWERPQHKHSEIDRVAVSCLMGTEENDSTLKVRATFLPNLLCILFIKMCIFLIFKILFHEYIQI